MKDTPGKIKKRCMKLCNEIVKLRDGNVCAHCGKVADGAGMHVSHIIPRSADGRLSVQPDNCLRLCFHCHINWWHKNPIEAAEWFEKAYPYLSSLIKGEHALNREKGPISIVEWREIENDLKEKRKQYDS